MRSKQIYGTLLAVCLIWAPVSLAQANPWNGKVVLQAFWWDCDNKRYETNTDGTGGWYTYLAKLAPRLRDLGFDGVWVPPPAKGDNVKGMGYDLYDHYDLGSKFQREATPTRFGDQDAFLRMIAVMHANGLEVYPDIVLNHMSGGSMDPTAWGDNKFKSFQYVSFAGPGMGRWLKSWLDFHPNPHHSDGSDEWREKLLDSDVCYRGRCCDRDCDGGSYMRDQARQWFIWFHKQTDADGYRFDAVKHFQPEVVEDLLYNALDAGKPETDQRRYFAVGEFAGGLNDLSRLDDWASQTKNRCGTFDFAFRGALVNLVNAHGAFDLGSLPNFQQHNRIKTVPFVNNHDTWRGVHPDSSGNNRDDRGRPLQNQDEKIGPTIDPDDEWTRLAYAAAIAVDGSPQVYYEDLFDNRDSQKRHRADPNNHPTRSYVENLVWCHQKLNFKDGAYKVRFQASPDLLIIERSARALIGLNDSGNNPQSAIINTDFGPGVRLHDYSGSTTADLTTDSEGKVNVTVPPKSYVVLGPSGISGGFAGNPRRTNQEFQLDDDLGDSDPRSLGYGGRVVAGAFRKGGAVWVASGSVVKVWSYTSDRRSLDLRVSLPTGSGAKATDQGQHEKQGIASPNQPVYLEFTAAREGYYQLSARLSQASEPPVRAYLKVEYEAPRTSTKF